MCGILCEVCFSSGKVIVDEKVLQSLRNRGPNNYQAHYKTVNDDINIHFHGAVLWMQGNVLVKQPVLSDEGVLLYNGDIFDNTWDSKISDTQLMMEKMQENYEDSLNIVKVLRTLKGPFSIIYYDQIQQNLYFTRDRVGRCSLLFHMNKDSIIISSVLGRNYSSVEVPATHIHKLNIINKTITAYPWAGDESKSEEIGQWLEILKGNQSLSDEEHQFDCHLKQDFVDKNNIIEFIKKKAIETSCKIKLMNKLLENFQIKDTVCKITQLLEESVRIRLDRQPKKCKNCLFNIDHERCDHSTIGVLFSGGLDCTILAYLADKYVQKEQSIDLINVAFKKGEGTYDVPDRLTGRQSFEQLQKLCSSRKWVFHEVNVPMEEAHQWQKTSIADLVHPRQTILDESLGSALWFAARGVTENAVSCCRVLLLGSGADELFGGYTRHRNAFRRRSWTGLEEELLLDWHRIAFRNLARDNRVICDSGRQPRMPYLDEDFTQFVLQLPPWLRCFPSEEMGPGIGDKLMLRLVAYNLGLQEVSVFPKRALQFGSRIANKKEKGSDISKNFKVD